MFLKKVFLYFKYRKKKFKSIGTNVDYKQMNSKFLYSENISIQNDTKVLDFAFFDGIGKIEIGKCVIIAPHVTILTSNHNYDNNISSLPFDNIMYKKEVQIGDFSWIGRNVMIMPGVKIGKAVVVAAGSVVTKNIEDYAIIGGNPAKVIKFRKKEKIDNLINNNMCINLSKKEKEYI